MNALKLSSTAVLITLIYACSSGDSQNQVSTQTPAETKSEQTQTEPTQEQQPTDHKPITLYVSKQGNDTNDGSQNSPFLTINKAAQEAKAGDTVIVAAGQYREWIKPARGGDSENTRITYQAAAGELVEILGSMQATGWQQLDNGTWQLQLTNEDFPAFNPFTTLLKHPEKVEEDEAGDGWGWLKYGRDKHLGDIVINDKGLTEVTELDQVNTTPMSWLVQTHQGTTTLYANFDQYDPNQQNVELNALPHAFFPEKNNINFITFKGFVVKNVASHWAPPTVFQPGAVGSNGGHHWKVEDNVILNAKTLCISFGIPTTQVAAAIKGHHQIRRNIIANCGQGGIAGQSWATDSIIENNFITNINYRREFGGWETAGIKHHNSNNLVIKGNYISDIYTQDPSIGAAHGIWNDFQNRNWVVENNVIVNAQGHGILTEANWSGPNLWLNNILIDSSVATYSTRGDVFAHNTFINSSYIWENQPWGNRVAIDNSAWLNNMFVNGGSSTPLSAKNNVYQSNMYLAEAKPLANSDQTLRLPNEKISIEVEEANSDVVLHITASLALDQHKVQAVTTDVLPVTLKSAVSFNQDFFQKNRSEDVAVGAINSLIQGEQSLTVYNFSEFQQQMLQQYSIITSRE